MPRLKHFALLEFSDPIVNNNELQPTTNNRGYDRPRAKALGMVRNHQAQFASFNFPNAPICAIASSANRSKHREN
jgi:hypothetical protein